ncbi:MAG: DinB family protein [Spirochaetia bacterium]
MNWSAVRGGRWTRAGVLASLVKHQIQHRAQMTVLMRQTGIRVPGVYGPAQGPSSTTTTRSFLL